MRETRPLPLETELGVARQVCDALACLHAHGVVHRDIKPENVLVTSAGHVKILDFGIALLESARRLTWAGLSHAIGTPAYVAPEQVRGRVASSIAIALAWLSAPAPDRPAATRLVK